ncbi:MAG: hypothetical protein JKX98_08140 [Alcanivoracaceae bacterium]|nr:hypothetical protein [Alcanivoracaceae bacterium]
MKKINDSTFNIEKITMRELNSDEINEVGGGLTLPCLISVSLIVSCFGPATGCESDIIREK